MNNPYGLEALWTQGDAIIKGVAVVLLLMSIASWLVILARALHLWQLRHQAKALNAFWQAHNFDEGLQRLQPENAQNPYRLLAETGRDALTYHRTHGNDLNGQLPLTEWLTTAIGSALDESRERLQRGLAILASVGSTAPFVGLFGTVWGIYHALVGIGVSGQASIDKVAGPVGEALIMTAFGLAVAIPAVLGYNAITRGNKGVLGRLDRFARQLHAYLITGTPTVNPTDKGAR
ncbi:MotA/TolQ/ExbB proton channel family protein [Saccharospirillum mangrovi]|uniref:MotA/TolQ/ExbB proton channel family protein n=1 Tax=Saccharospirillum mangrovi TaxID=2161747 RepID=UPI000D331C06|nr:MotA/TolQ/ExbB proton channel family protein [Saccharospirillum mangrovi]